LSAEITQASQTISFTTMGTKTFGQAPFTLSATGGGSGNAVTFQSDNLSVATVLGNTVTIVGAGTATITVSQSGNTNYAAATDVIQTLTVNQASQTISFPALIACITLGGRPAGGTAFPPTITAVFPRTY
jgi:hypothetical protein